MVPPHRSDGTVFRSPELALARKVLFIVAPEIMKRCLEPPDLLRLHCQSLLRAYGLLCGRSRACARGPVTKRAISWLREPKRTPGEESSRETQYSSDPISALHRSGLMIALCSDACLASYKEFPSVGVGCCTGPSIVDSSGRLRGTCELKPT